MNTFELMQELIEKTNSLADGDTCDDMLKALVGSHRTLQQAFMRQLYEMLCEYADESTDARNEASVEFAKKVKALEHHFPLV